MKRIVIATFVKNAILQAAPVRQKYALIYVKNVILQPTPVRQKIVRHAKVVIIVMVIVRMIAMQMLDVVTRDWSVVMAPAV